MFMTNPTCSPAAALSADSRRETEKAKGRKRDGGNTQSDVKLHATFTVINKMISI